MAIAIFNAPGFRAANIKQIEAIPHSFFIATQTGEKENAYIPMNVNGGWISLPYKLDAENGTFSGIEWDPYDFRAMLVKGSSFDKERFFDETRTRVARDLSFYNLLKKQFPNDYDEKRLPFYGMAKFRGDEDRFKGTDDEVNEKLFYWHIVQILRETMISCENGEQFNSGDFDKNSRVNDAVLFGKKIEELFNNLDEDDWLAVYGVDE